MGVAPSKIEDDKVLVLCQERKRFVREALDGRRALAASHYAYILSLRETGSLLRKIFEPEASKESIPNSSPPLLHANQMKVSRNSTAVIQEVSVPAIATIQSSFPAVGDARQDSDDAHGTRCLREDEGIPELENDFDNLSTETLVRVFKNKNDVPLEKSHSPLHHSLENTDFHRTNSKNKRTVIGISTNANDETSAVTPVNVVQLSNDVLSMDGESKESYPDVCNVVNDLNSCMKILEMLFHQACDSGKEVPRILEEDKIQFPLLLPEEIAHGLKPSSFVATLFACCREDVTVPESPSQAEIRYLTWHRSMSSHLSPSRNPPGTNAGSHISTLDRLYAWESKLYDEVKASNAICRRYNEKCKELRHQESRGESQIGIDFTRAKVKDLHSRILVAVQKIDFISKNIEDLRDKSPQPQLDELIGCLTRMWATMLECHQRQCTIIKLVSRSYNLEIVIQSEPQCQAALLLSVELRKLCSNFRNWMASHKAYLCCLNLLLHKCMKPLKKRKVSRKQSVVDVTLTECAVAPIFTTCEIWMKLLDDLPTEDLEETIEGVIADISHSIPQMYKMPTDETEVEILTSHAPADLQSSLRRFLEKLEAFSEVSLQKYIDLQKNISAAKERISRKY